MENQVQEIYVLSETAPGLKLLTKIYLLAEAILPTHPNIEQYTNSVYTTDIERIYKGYRNFSL